MVLANITGVEHWHWTIVSTRWAELGKNERLNDIAVTNRFGLRKILIGWVEAVLGQVLLQAHDVLMLWMKQVLKEHEDLNSQRTRSKLQGRGREEKKGPASQPPPNPQ